ncbi:MAG TPA: winged helix-turn-helix domain-containing protein [Vicinamibacteria bacterium]|nr:winged helix-turn-helix domain-containing protein [Vicinamibacteria bacterium]
MARLTLDDDGFRLDEGSHELCRGSRRIRLAEKPFRVLLALKKADGSVVTRDVLRKRLWSDDTFVDFDNNLNSAVTSLRRALGDSAAAPRYIETIPRVGYRLLARKRSLGSRRSLALWAVGTVLMTIAVAGVSMWSRPDAPESAALSPARPQALSLIRRGKYLHARYLTGRGNEDLLAARAAFREAFALDPGHAMALAEEGDVLMDMSFAGLIVFRDGVTQARAVSERALSVEPENVPALRVMAMAALFLDWDLAASRKWLDRATAGASAQDARTALAAATYFSAAGDHEAAIAEAERAVALDPAAYYVRADLAFFYLAAGLNERAAEEATRVIEVAPEFPPAHVFAVLANERLARWDEAAQSAQVLLHMGWAPGTEPERIDGAEPKDVVAFWRHWDLERIRTRAEAVSAGELALSLGLRHAALGNRAQALDHLELAFAHRAPLLVFLPSFPELYTLRSEPRFEKLLQRVHRGGIGSALSAPDIRSPLFPGAALVDVE